MKDYIEAHAYSINHRPELSKPQQCGCFYCMKIFSSEEIVQWLKDKRGTALCPYCGIDSVIGECAGYPITEEFLRKMNGYWFGNEED